MVKIPIIPKLPPQETKPVKPDLRVRIDREEVLQGLDEGGRLYHVWDQSFAVGPRNLRYALATLLTLESEGVVVAVNVDGTGQRFTDQIQQIKEREKEPPSCDDEGTPGNAPARIVWWQRAPKAYTTDLSK